MPWVCRIVTSPTSERSLSAVSKAELATCEVDVLSFVVLVEEWLDGIMIGFSVLSDSNCFGRVR